MNKINLEQQEAQLAHMTALAGLSTVTITTEDRLRGAVIEAIKQLEDGQVAVAYLTLLEAARL